MTKQPLKNQPERFPSFATVLKRALFKGSGLFILVWIALVILEASQHKYEVAFSDAVIAILLLCLSVDSVLMDEQQALTRRAMSLLEDAKELLEELANKANPSSKKGK